MGAILAMNEQEKGGHGASSLPICLPDDSVPRARTTDIHVKLYCTHVEVVNVMVNPLDSWGELAQCLEKEQKIPADQVRIVHAGIQREPSKLLNLQRWSTVHILYARPSLWISYPGPPQFTGMLDPIEVPSSLSHTPSHVRANSLQISGVRRVQTEQRQPVEFLVDGPADSPYEGGTFCVLLHLLNTTPVLQMRTPIIHPLVLPCWKKNKDTWNGRIAGCVGFLPPPSTEPSPAGNTIPLTAAVSNRLLALVTHMKDPVGCAALMQQGEGADHPLVKRQCCRWSDDSPSGKRENMLQKARAMTLLVIENRWSPAAHAACCSTAFRHDLMLLLWVKMRAMPSSFSVELVWLMADILFRCHQGKDSGQAVNVAHVDNMEAHDVIQRGH